MADRGAMMGKIRSQLGGTAAVTSNRFSGEETVSFLAPLVAMNSCAPSFMASAFFLSELDRTTTRHPILAANWMARCPRPPTPKMPTVSLGLMPCRAVKVVAPPHWRGAASTSLRPLGMMCRNDSRQMAWEAKLPWSRFLTPYMARSGQNVSDPWRHSMQWPQLSTSKPQPT